MATEILNSDSPDPLIITSPAIARTVTTASTPSTVSDTDSSPSVPLSRHRSHPRYSREQERQHNSNFQRAIETSFTSFVNQMSRDPDEVLQLLDRLVPREEYDLFIDDDDYYPFGAESVNDNSSDDHDHEYDSVSDSESLFVDDRQEEDVDEDEDDDINLIGARHIQRPSQNRPWPNSSASPDLLPSDDLFDGFTFTGRMDRNLRNNRRDELVDVEIESTNPQRNQRGSRQRQPRAQPEVIDLTGENDNVTQLAPAVPRNRSQNTRRQRSQQQGTPPQLNRTDTGYMELPTVIDLISDSDEEPNRMPPPRSNSPGRNQQEVPRGQPRRSAQPPEPGHNTLQHRLHRLINGIPLPLIHLLNNHPPMADNEPIDDLEIVMLGQRNLDAMVAPNVPTGFDYNAVAFGNGAPAPGGLNTKPAHEPPKETREGFTRDTGEDVVAICPSCDEELAYDPDDDGSSGPPAKKARTKKDKAEHHFWAVKACGHVYCRKCYENRRPVGKKPIPVGFTQDNSGTKHKIICAVEDCNSDVTAKNSWVGIFL
ncbi:uncharacterized protein F4822DRAFT_423757 [Hypoxylon trugodes]|uniref:uncharacterized protein n=1 Tax=Hypoxylon trugodes TaxID=326681 RepID=UPI0021934C9E|nr:uncharacterized protein F4822DRAFT_423757 [Hypoxylon trugodes]KAI1393289.1 hypothetical protein F4822DRAFT_423757 [Hypoxylon trugodes]